MKNIKAILFDMDGTLIDTEPLGIETLNHLLIKNKVMMTEKDWTLFDKVWRRDDTEITAEKFFVDIIEKYEINIEESDFIKSFYETYEQLIIKAKSLPGADKLLKKLHGKYKLALVTASTRSQAMAIIKQNGWEDIFDTILSYEEYKIKKPNPASFLMAAKNLEILPKECIVVEDSKNGVLAGKNANMYVVGVRAGNRNPQDISSADEIIETLSDINFRI
jgi:HAD superfamily hydrolase (TIGR01509 family)